MASSEYYRVVIDGNYLTESGLVPNLPTNLPCRVLIDGLEGLELDETAPAPVKAITGKPWKFIQPNTGAGVDLVLTIQTTTTSLYDDLRDAFNTANGAGATINLILTDGELPDRDLECVLGEIGLKAGKSSEGFQFTDGYIFDVTIQLCISSIN